MCWQPTLFLYCQSERQVLLTSTLALRCYFVISNTERSCIQKRNKLYERKEKSQGILADRDSRQRRNRLVTWSVQDSPQSECRPAVTPRQGMLMTHPPMLGLPTQQVHLPRGRKRSRPLDTAPCFKKWDNSSGPDQNKGGFHLFLSSLTTLLTCIGTDSSNKIPTIHLAQSRGVLNTVNFVCDTKNNPISSVKNMERNNAYSKSPNLIPIKPGFCRNTFILVKGRGPLYLWGMHPP